MTTSPAHPQTAKRPTAPWAELLLIVGLPLAVLIAGAITTVLAYREGFTATPAAASFPGH